MDRYTTAVRRYILIQHEEEGNPLDSKELHVRFVDTWRRYRLYDMWIDDGRVVDPRFPRLYILVDGKYNVRWMTEKEGDEYQKDSDLCLRKAVLWMEHSMNKKKVN